MDAAISNISASRAKIPEIPLMGSASTNALPKKEISEKASVEPATLSNDAIQKLLDDIQQQLDAMNISLSFSTYGEGGKNIAIIVREKETGKVIREIPSKELQHLYTKLGELIGIIFNHSI